MNNEATQATFKQFIASLSSELAERGHGVPRELLLDAGAAALKQRSWNHLCAKLKQLDKSSSSVAKPTSIEAPTNAFLPSLYDLFEARLARTLGIAKQPLPRSELGLLAAKQMLNDVYIDFELETSYGARLELHWNPITNKVIHDAYEGAVGQLSCKQIPAMKTVRCTIEEQNRISANLRFALEDALLPEVETFGLPFSGPYVSAECHSDDRVAACYSLDGRPFLCGLSDEKLVQLWGIGLTGDYLTDDIAEKVFEHLPTLELQEFFDYLNACTTVRKDIGFECSLDRDSFVNWLKAERRHVYDLLLCDDKDVQIEVYDDGYAFAYEYQGTATHSLSYTSHEDAIQEASLSLQQLGAELEGLF